VTIDSHTSTQHVTPYDADLTAAVADARRGSEAGFTAVYRALHPALLGYLQARLGDDEAAAEAASAVWREIAHGVFSFQGDGTDFRIWAMGLACGQAQEHPRPGPAKTRARADDTDDVRRALSALPSNLADALALREIAGLDDAAAARLLDTTVPFAQAAADRAAWLVADCLASRPAPTGPSTEWSCTWC
jgi:RNA polymerase sigma-70 factor (ECF subfamily)